MPPRQPFGITMRLFIFGLRGTAMFNLSLTACSFIIKKNNTRNVDKIFSLNSSIRGFHEEEEFCFNDAIELFADFFGSYAEIVTDVGKQQTFSCECDLSFRDETEGFRLLYAKVFSGIYGSSSDIIDANTKKVKFSKSSTDIDTRPFYVFVIVPKDSEEVTVQKGMLIFQNVGQFGIKTITTDYMQAHFSGNWGITLKCRTIAPDLFIKKVIRRDNIKKLVMVKNMKSTDRSDNIGIGYGKEVREIADLNFSEALWDKMFDKIRWVAGSRYNLFEFENKEYNTLKVVVDIGGRNRKIDLHNLDNLSIIEAIPDEIRMADGHPNRDMLIEYFKQVAAEYLKEMVLQIS